jgi:hypothetical protein
VIDVLVVGVCCCECCIAYNVWFDTMAENERHEENQAMTPQLLPRIPCRPVEDNPEERHQSLQFTDSYIIFRSVDEWDSQHHPSQKEALQPTKIKETQIEVPVPLSTHHDLFLWIENDDSLSHHQGTDDAGVYYTINDDVDDALTKALALMQQRHNNHSFGVDGHHHQRESSVDLHDIIDVHALTLEEEEEFVRVVQAEYGLLNHFLCFSLCY